MGFVGDVWGIQNAMVAVNTSANAEIKLEVGDSVVFKRKGEIIDGKIIGINSNVLIVEYGKGKKIELKFDEVTKTNK
jgi:preprotein translocase subunit YajC